MNRLIRHGTWIAWALCGFLISAALDKVPDSPAEVKRLTHSSTFSCDHPSRPAVDPDERAGRPAADHRATPARRLQPQRLDASKQLNQPRLLCQAADSSPPQLRFVTL